MQEQRRRQYEEDDRQGRGRSSDRSGEDMRYVPDYEDFRTRRGGQRQDMGRYGSDVERSWRDQGDGGYSGSERWRDDDSRRSGSGSSMGDREDYGGMSSGYRASERSRYQPFDPEEAPRGYDRGSYGRGRDSGYESGWGMGGSRLGGGSNSRYEGGSGSSGRYEREVANPWNRGIRQSSGASSYGDSDRELDRWSGEGGSQSMRYGRESGGWSQSGSSYGGNFTGRGPKGYRRSDDRIREDISDRLTEDGRIDASEIEVAVKNGEVTLSGTVRDRDQKRCAEDLAERISGVSEVTNNIRMARGNGAAEPNESDSGSMRGSGSSSSGQSGQGSQSGMSSTGKTKSTQTS